MIDVLLYIAVLGALGLLGYVGYLYLTGQLQSGLGGGALFGPKPDKRLEVVEQWNVDARRKLVLIRRDDVEHLIMTGGPVDVVIETGIGASGAARSSDQGATVTGLARTSVRAFGRAPTTVSHLQGGSSPVSNTVKAET
jgi:flagellar protein FliO/FliZ